MPINWGMDKEMRYIHTMDYYSAIKNETTPSAATWMDLGIIVRREVSRRKTNITWHHLYVESKIWHKWTYLWDRNQIYRQREQTCGGQGGWSQGRDALGPGVSRWTIIENRWGNYIQYSVINHKEIKYEKIYIYL